MMKTSGNGRLTLLGSVICLKLALLGITPVAVLGLSCFNP